MTLLPIPTQPQYQSRVRKLILTHCISLQKNVSMTVTCEANVQWKRRTAMESVDGQNRSGTARTPWMDIILKSKIMCKSSIINCVSDQLIIASWA